MSGDATSGFPNPRSITSSPARRSSSLMRSTSANAYGGSWSMRRKSKGLDFTEDRVAAMRVVLLPGDGIGPEIAAVARRALERLAPDVEIEERPFGGAAIRA